MQKKYFLAVCDILGFSALVENNPLGAVVDHSIAWFRKSLHHSIHKNGFPEQVPETAELDRHKHIGVAWFSDTILFHTKKDDDEAVRELLMAVGWLVFETIVQGKTRVRAGVAYGDAFIDPNNSIFVGKPIVEAYRLEQAQQWSGAALSPSACDRVPEQARSGEYADWWVTPYDVPMKGHTTNRTLAVNWNWGIHHPTWRIRWSKESESPTQADWAKDPSLCEKFLNTKTFHEAHCRDCNRTHEPYPSLRRTVSGVLPHSSSFRSKR